MAWRPAARPPACRPLADRMAQVRKSAQGSVPPDYARRQAEMLAWSKSVGWID